MTMLINKHIVLGVTGGIAAYKSAILARRLIDAGATVRVVMTEGALAFMQPMTFQALTGQEVHTDLLDPQAEAAMGHIELARWADLILIAPASANTLARLAHGMADDLLTTLCLATQAPVYVAPAMNRLMWSNAATRSNCRQLESRGFRFIGPAEGEQACGETGAGRLPEPEAIRDALLADLSVTGLNQTPSGNEDQSLLAGRHLVITAGPTREAIDPVRYISNRSSGKMGFALAEEAIRLGASVTLIAGPVSLECSDAIDRVDVITAQEMHAAVLDAVPRCQVFIGVAAVSDYRLNTVQNQKIKKTTEQLQLTLVRNPDILQAVAARPDRPFCVGFAAETEQVETHARDKMRRKNLDMIAANHVAQKENEVFGSDTNAIDVYWAKGDGHKKIPTAPKQDVARALLILIAAQLG